MAKRSAVRTTRRRLHAADSSPLSGVGAGELDEHLQGLASLLEARAHEGDDGPQILRVTRDGITADGIDVGLRPIHDLDDNVVDALTGFTAPDDWLALGVATGGQASPVADADERRRVRVVHLVSRSGASASVIRFDGDPPNLVQPADGDPVAGRVDDVCRRALGLPTAAAGATLELWTVRWLEALIGAGTDGIPTEWEGVAACHPAVQALVEADTGSAPEAAAEIVRLARLMARVVDWPLLRAECGAGRCPMEGVTPAVALWLDDGAFARWALGAHPPLEVLMSATCELLMPGLARRLDEVVHEWHPDIGSRGWG